MGVGDFVGVGSEIGVGIDRLGIASGGSNIIRRFVVNDSDEIFTLFAA